MAYQTYIVHVLAISSIFLALIAGNMVQLGITNPWFTVVIIPGLVGAIFYGGNQMKSIGSPAPNTVTETRTTTVTPPEPPKVP
jgi:flagellar motor component MotA